jgi:putative zinc finger/helix-turn-helix YgiT family protein
MNTNQYLFCTRCGSEEFAPKPDAVLEQEFKGETFNVTTPAMACAKCGELALTDAQLEELRRRTADAYRKKHNLLTSAQIRAMREALGKTQHQFAAFLRVGEASVKRWETWLVQDAGNDELIRVKCVLAKKAQLLKRMTQALLQSQAAGWTQAARLQTAEQTDSLLASLSRYLNTGQTISDATTPPTLAEPVSPSPVQFFTQWLHWAPQAAQAPEHAFVQIGAIQFHVLSTDYTANAYPRTPWLPGISQDDPQGPPNRQTTFNHRRDFCNDSALAAAA